MTRPAPAAFGLAAALLAAPASAQFSIDWYTIDAGGGTSSGGGFTLSGTIGQPDAGPTLSGGAFELTGGFWAATQNASACSPADVTTAATNPGDPGYGVPDGSVTVADLTYFVEFWIAGDLGVADITTAATNPGDPGFGVPDGSVTVADLTFFVEIWIGGCP